MTDEIVWVSRAPMDSSLIKGFSNDLRIADRDKAIDAMRRNEAGESLPAERFPKEFYRNSGEKVQRLPDLANAGGFWLVSARVAETLRKFDLGRTTLHPTSVLQNNRKTPVEGEYLCINFGETKECFLPGQSRARKPWEDRDLWKLHLAPKDDDFALSAAALEGPDLWIEERVIRAFFLSDRLVRALRAAGLTRRLGLRRCRVVPQGE